MRNDENKTSLILAVCGIVPVVWLALLTAPYVSGGIVEIIGNLSVAINNPFSITVCEDSVKTVLIFLLAYAMGIGIYLSTRRNYRRREEHGSAKWGNAGTLNKKYRDKDASQNKLLTQNVRIGLDGRKHRRNLNILVCGGSGAGKTRFFCKPNAMQCNTSMVILDPKGEIVRDVGGLLEKKGYEVRVLDLINMHKSHCYNPFVYLRNDNDVQRLVTNLFKATTKLPMTGKVRTGFRRYCVAVLALTMVLGTSMTAFAANDPIQVVNNLSDFIFGLVRAVGMIMLGFGIVQIGLSLKSHDPSQRANGFLTLAGGVVITFAKEILTLITG